MNSEPQAPASSSVCRILSLDGGGAKGFYTLGVLKEIEAMCGCPLYQTFDLIFGTSTGAIIAALVALGSSVDDIHALYREHVPTVMSRRTARGKSKALAHLAEVVFGNRKFTDLKTGIGIVATRWDFEKPMIFKTDVKQAHGRESTFVPGFGCSIADAVQASCSAYPFFEKATLGGWYWCRYRYWGLPSVFSKGEIGILVAEVPGDIDRQRQIAYARAIYSLTQQDNELAGTVKVRLIERPLPADPEFQNTEAIRLGRQLHATFVLRPWTVENVQDPWLTVIDQPEFARTESSMGSFSNMQLAELDKLRLPHDLILLAHAAMGLSLYHRESFSEAASQFTEVLSSTSLPQVGPARCDLQLLLGNALFGAGQIDAAIGAFHAATQLKPEFATAHRNLGVSLWKAGNNEEAIAEFEKTIALEPKNDLAHADLGEIFINERKFDNAISELSIACSLNPKDAAMRNNLGLALAQKGRLEEAIGEEEKAIALKPDDSGLHSSLATTLGQKGQLDRAIREYYRAIALKPNAALPHSNLGATLCQVGRCDEGITELRQAVRLQPDFESAHDELGFRLAERGQIDEGIGELRQAIVLSPGDAHAHNNLGYAFSRKQQWDDAILEARQAVVLKPDFAEAHKNLAYALLMKQQWDDAIVEARQAAALIPRDTVNYDIIARGLYMKGKTGDAIIELRKVIVLQPNDAQAHYGLGEMLRSIGEQEKAAQEFQEAHRLNPSLQAPEKQF